MPNGGFRVCGRCGHFNENACLLRDVRISQPMFTTCNDHTSGEARQSDSKTDGPICSLSPLRDLRYTKIPWFRNRKFTVEESPSGCSHVIIVYDDRVNDYRRFYSLDEYLLFWERNEDSALVKAFADFEANA